MVVLLRASPAERPLAREPGSLQGEPVPGVRPSDPEQVSAPLSFPCLRFLPCCELGSRTTVPLGTCERMKTPEKCRFVWKTPAAGGETTLFIPSRKTILQALLTLTFGERGAESLPE